MNKLQKLQEILQDLESVLVAYSGGVDSALLLAVAQRTLGEDQVLAVTASSELIPAEEISAATELARRLGVRHLIVPASDLDNPELAANTPQRCYHCKKHRFLLLLELAKQYELRWLVEGSNLDDLNDYRPGARAVQELGIKSPLQEAGLTKAEIRRLAKEIDLPVWNKPASPCLATRIPYGIPLTGDVLQRIDEAESYLRKQLGISQLRIRHHQDVARLELPVERLAQMAAKPWADIIVQELKRLGYTYVTLDLAGYRTGSMNENLEMPR